jgi:hypothetical protein
VIEMALLNPYLNPFAQTNDEIDDILFISDRERTALENEKKEEKEDE